MITKFITVFVKPGHMDDYLAAQEVWNRETRSAPGYLGCTIGRDPNEPDIVYLNCHWRSRDDLRRWMESDHDRIAAAAKADDHYERIEVRVLDSFTDEPTFSWSRAVSPASDTAQIQTWTEVYRASAALRSAMRLGLFDLLAIEPVTTDRIASRLNVEAMPLDKVLRALEPMGLVRRVPNGWRNTPLADRTLVAGSSAYQGDMVLHNTQPEYVDRVFRFGEKLGLPRDLNDPGAFHARFLAAMRNTAAGGQAEALVSRIDLTGCACMIDIGGATGPYAIALCSAHPSLHCTVLDQPETISLAEPLLSEADLGGRVTIAAHDYRRGPFPGPVDVALISNVLRGEPPAAVDDILRRVRDALSPEGRLLVTDLFPGHPRADVQLRAALFGLHMPGGSNYSLDRMAAAVEEAGFDALRAEYLADCVVMSGLIEARPNASASAT